MDFRFVMTPEGTGKKNDAESAKRACNYFRMDDIPVSPVLSFSFLDEGEWLRRYLTKELLKKSSTVAVCADEVTEDMIALIKLAQKLELPIRFYDADLHEINVDALVINRRIGPGLRKMIMDVHGISCAEGGCPYGAVASNDVQETVKAEAPVVEAPLTTATAESAETKKSFFQKLFGRR